MAKIIDIATRQRWKRPAASERKRQPAGVSAGLCYARAVSREDQDMKHIGDVAADLVRRLER